MKKSVTCFLFLYLILPVSPDDITDLRAELDLINNKAASFTQQEIKDINVYKDLDPDHYSYESISISNLTVINMVKYFDGEDIRKIKVSFIGEREELYSEYYYMDGLLFFSFKRRVSYRQPKWSELFNEEDKTIQENRYYFKNQELIMWIDGSQKEVDLKGLSLNISEQIISDSSLYLSIDS